jgi:hypothetical protein
MWHAIAISSAAMGNLSNEEAGLSASGPDRPGESPDNSSNDASTYDRDLGVIEAITYVTRSCPNGRVVAAAQGALEAIKTGGSDSLKQQAYFVLVAIQGWRGDRAHQVHRSLSRYLDPDES